MSLFLTKRDIRAINSLRRFARSVSHNLRQSDMHFALGIYRKECFYGHNDYTPKGNFTGIHKYLTPHAESAVLIQMGEVDALYVIRINTAGEYLVSTPCEECFGLIRAKKVKQLVFSIDKGLTKVRVS